MSLFLKMLSLFLENVVTVFGKCCHFSGRVGRDETGSIRTHFVKMVSLFENVVIFAKIFEVTKHACLGTACVGGP